MTPSHGDMAFRGGRSSVGQSGGLIIRWSLVRVQPAPLVRKVPAQKCFSGEDGRVITSSRFAVLRIGQAKMPAESTCGDQRINLPLGHAKALVMRRLPDRGHHLVTMPSDLRACEPARIRATCRLTTQKAQS